MNSTSDISSEELARQGRQLETLDRLAERFGRSLDGALTAGASSGRELGSVLDKVAASLSSSLGRSAGSALSNTLTGALQDATRSLSESAIAASFGGASPFAAGGLFQAGRVTPFAQGGVVAAPTFFPMANGLGLMGESGPEAVMPLARGPDGRLGVQAPGGSAAPITIHIATRDAESFRRSETQVSAALARAVARGRRAT